MQNFSDNLTSFNINFHLPWNADDKYSMKKRRLFEDLLDDVDEIRPDVLTEDEPDIFVPEPGYDHSAFIMLRDVDPDSDYLIERFSDVLDAEADEWRIGKITGNDRMQDFASMFTDEWRSKLTRMLDKE